jgi:hypothetical protein
LRLLSALVPPRNKDVEIELTVEGGSEARLRSFDITAETKVEWRV